MSNKLVRNLYRISVASALLGISTLASASAFQLFEENVSGLGNFWAGAAAIADDASTAFYNPAGLTMIPDKQIVVAGTGVLGDLDVKGTSQQNIPSLKNFPVPGFYSPYSQSGSAEGGTNAFIPAFFFSAPLTNRVFFGFGVTAPFGLATDYSDNSYLRYAATKSELTTIDLNQDLAFKITDNFSLGVGINALYASAELDQMIGTPGAITAASNPTGNDTTSINKGNDWGYGWNAGALYQLTPTTRVGLSYRSPITVKLEGTSELTGPLASTFPFTTSATVTSNNLASRITLPSTTMLSIYQGVTQQLAVMGTVNYTTWDEIKNITLTGTAGSGGSTNGTSTLPQNFRNTWRFAAGANYAVTNTWTLKGGVGYDQSPVNNHDRGVRLPSSNDFALSAGTHYQAFKNIGFDVGYAHLFFEQAKIYNTVVSGSQMTFVNAKAKAGVNIVGGQVTWDLG